MRAAVVEELSEMPSTPERLVRLDHNSLCFKESHDPLRRPPHTRTSLFHIHAHNMEAKSM
jgi:hypothetical protein